MIDASGLKEKIIEIITPVLEAHFAELVDIEFKSRKGQKVVIIYIYKNGGVSVKDCAELSDIIGEVFDVDDLFPYSYVLEVSSPGLDRPLREKRDFERYMGKMVDIYFDEQDMKNVNGIIKRVQIDGIQLETTGGVIDIPFTKIIRAKNLIRIKDVD